MSSLRTREAIPEPVRLRLTPEVPVALPLNEPPNANGAFREMIGASLNGIITLPPVKFIEPRPERNGKLVFTALTKKNCVPSMVMVPDTSVNSHCPERAERLKAWPGLQRLLVVQGAKPLIPKRPLPATETRKSVPEALINIFTNPKGVVTVVVPSVISLEFAGTDENRSNARTTRKVLSMWIPFSLVKLAREISTVAGEG
jgi:hypothetical protein